MKILKEYFSKLNFTDHIVNSMLLNFKLKTLELKTDGVSLKSNDKWKELGEATIKISNWKSIMISIYETKEKKWKNLDESNYDTLKEICEADFNNNMILRGFGKKTGQWLQYEIISPMVDIDFNQPA